MDWLRSPAREMARELLFGAGACAPSPGARNGLAASAGRAAAQRRVAALGGGRRPGASRDRARPETRIPSTDASSVEAIAGKPYPRPLTPDRAPAQIDAAQRARPDAGAPRVAAPDMEQGLTRNGPKSGDLIDQRASALIGELYLGAEGAPAAGFRRWALERARRFVPFHSALWGTGSVGPRLTIDAVELVGQTPEMLERYRRRWLRQDLVAREVLAQVGSTVNLAAIAPRESFLRSPFYRQFGRRYGIAHVLSTAIANRPLGLVTIVSWWRDDSGEAFTEGERQFKQFLMPHLVQACGISTFLQLRRTGADGGAQDASGAYALATERGLLTGAEPEFAALLKRARPDWCGPALPPELRKPLRHPDGDEHTALGLHLRVTRSAEQIVLRLREPMPIDRLSPAERRVAQQLAGGLTHRQIAAQLSLAPSTVRNHLHTIYRKLGVANRVQMVNELHLAVAAPAALPPEPR